jgi:hypothetical protein
MATYRNPGRNFATKDLVELLIENRVELGFSPSAFLHGVESVAKHLDAFVFGVFTFRHSD